MQRRRRPSLLLVLVLPLLGGCGTIASVAVAGSGVPPIPGRRLWPLGAVYCGVAMDLQVIRRGTPSGRVLAAIDLPLSLSLDTLLLPVTLSLQVALWASRLADDDDDLDGETRPPRADVAPVFSG